MREIDRFPLSPRHRTFCRSRNHLRRVPALLHRRRLGVV